MIDRILTVGGLTLLSRVTGFAPGGNVNEVAWMPDENNRDFLGNEFLLWLWYALENESDTIKLSDDSEVAVMIGSR